MMNPVRARTTTFRKRAFFASILLLFVGVLGSCGDPNSSPPGEVGGIETWTVAEEPSVVIGGADEREEYVLHRVVTATRLSDGRIVIANGGSEELKYFDAQGRHLFNAGGRGDGPGELRLLSHMARLPGDSILVLSLRPGLTHFGPDGEYVASRPLVLTEIGDQRCRMSESNWFVQSDGSIVTALTEAGRPGCPESAENPRRLSSLVGRYSPERDRFDTLALVPGPEYDGMFPRVHGGDISLAMTSGMVYVGDTGSDGILVFDLRGGGRSVHRVPFEPVRIPPEAKEGQPPPPPPGRNVLTPESYDYPEWYPRFGRILAAPGGRLWVMAYPATKEPHGAGSLIRHFAFRVEEGGARWKVLDSDGAPIAEIRTPPGFFAVEVGDDHILGLSKDEFDRQSVQLYRLMR